MMDTFDEERRDISHYRALLPASNTVMVSLFCKIIDEKDSKQDS